jgi:hypothetical protein
VTINSSNTEERGPAREAQSLLEKLHPTTGSQTAPSADDLLLFFYRLRDGYRIVHSTSERFRGSSFDFLHELLYQLESRPEETLQSGEWRSLIEALLHDLASVKLTLTRKGKL